MPGMCLRSVLLPYSQEWNGWIIREFCFFILFVNPLQPDLPGKCLSFVRSANTLTLRMRVFG